MAQESRKPGKSESRKVGKVFANRGNVVADLKFYHSNRTVSCSIDLILALSKNEESVV